MNALSIVIASLNGLPYLARCLDALDPQAADFGAQIVVADCVGPEVTDFVRAKYPEVHLIAFEGRRTVPELRAAALGAATGEVIALTEDHCVPPPDWCAAVLRAHSRHSGPAIGGAVDNGATARLIDWAVFFCEYGNFLSPVRRGVVDDLPGPNVSYKRTALGQLADQIAGGFREVSVHKYFEASGQALWSDPDIPMIHCKHFTLVGFLTERFHYSKAFTGNRRAAMSRGKRLFYLFASLALPPVLLLRLSRRVLGKPGHLGTYLLTLPHLLLFTVVWALGESVGYALGPGDSESYLA